jgi:hypothetical protein
MRCLKLNWIEAEAEAEAEAETGAGADEARQESERSGDGRRGDRRAEEMGASRGEDETQNENEIPSHPENPPFAALPIRIEIEIDMAVAQEAGNNIMGEAGRAARAEVRREVRSARARAGARARRDARAGAGAGAKARTDHSLRQNPTVVMQREAEARISEEKLARRREFIGKKEENERTASRRVNIPQLNSDQMRRVTKGLSDLFRSELNPMIEVMMPEPDDWEGWQAFEGSYEESLHCLRMHINDSIGQNSQWLYGAKRLNLTVQRATDTMMNVQKMRNDLKKLKNILHTITEGSGTRAREGAEARIMMNIEDSRMKMQRRRAKFGKRITSILNLLLSEKITEFFGSDQREAIWETLNTSEDHRDRVID